MSFTVRCPFCKAEMECPDDVLGQVGQCVSCGREIDLEPVDGSPVSVPYDDPDAREVRTMRAAAIAAMPSEMPRVTWGWAFDAVLKLTVAIIVIDGALGLILGIIHGLMGSR